MFVDPRQVVAGLLTLYMFTMLGNMVKQEHLSSPQAKLPSAPNAHFDVVRVEEEDVDTGPIPLNEGPWKPQGKALTPCWSKPDPMEPETSRGYITFSLVRGPEHHASQVAAAVVIARYLGAALVLPEIRGSELGQKRNFEDIYIVDKFMESLDGVVKIVKELPSEVKAQKAAVVKAPGRVTADYIRENIEPIFKRNSNLRLAILSSLDSPKMNLNPKIELDSVSCLATFGTLELNPEIQNVVHLMIERLRALSQRADGHFVAVDLRVDALDQKECRQGGRSGRKPCHNAQEIGELLRKIGFGPDTTIYVTQTWWDERLNALKGMFPKTYVKDDIIPWDEKGKFLSPGSGELLVQALDFFICSQSDVFVPAISGLFYEIVAGRRIASSRTQIFVPHQGIGASSPSDFNSTYVSKRSHMAYSCYC